MCNALLCTPSPKALTTTLSYSNSGRLVYLSSDSAVGKTDWWETQNVLLLDRSDDYLTMKPDFRSLLPKPWTAAIDVSVEFSDAKEGAKVLAQKCGLNNSIEPFFQKSMSYFQKLCFDMMLSSTNNLPKVKVRVVGTRGSPAIKCPRWHVDHVPLRWIQSLVGPGCDYVVDEEMVNRDALNALDWTGEHSVEEINHQIVVPALGATRQAPEGQAVILLGRSSSTPACVHKSPDLNLFQGRVLMTMDVVLPND